MILLEYGASWLHFIALMLGGGALVWRFGMRSALGGGAAVAGGSADAVPGDSVRRRIDSAAVRMARGSGMLVVIAFGAIFARQILEFRDPFVPMSDDVALLLSTDWGTAWRWGSIWATVAFLGLFATGMRGGIASAGWVVGGAALTMTGVYPAFTGHAASGDPVWLSIGADVLHVWAATAWIGGLGMLVVALRGLSRGEGAAVGVEGAAVGRESAADGGEDTDAASALVAAFSPIALASVAVLLVTGVIANWQHLGSPGEILTTSWGRILGVKLLLVIAVLVLGARNWRRLTADLGSADGNQAMRRSATTELLIGHLVLIVTAVLIRTSPG